jgi:hypothetical protein
MKRSGRSSTAAGRASRSVTADRLAGLRSASVRARKCSVSPVDDVLDDHDVPVGDRHIEVLEEADAAADPLGVCRQLDQVDPVDDRKRAREIGEEDHARLQRRHEQRLESGVVVDEELTELLYPGGDLHAGEIDLSDLTVVGRIYEASFSWYRWARRSMSRR